mmetsp:Transcript_17026/g.49567  ORF Transcript_17026/g.49567 Transcript_17026/m.49567 type:complete len:274 (-) Transcript_17026:37-858(-)
MRRAASFGTRLGATALQGPAPRAVHGRSLSTLTSLGAPKAWNPALFQDHRPDDLRDMVALAQHCKQSNLHELSSEQLEALAGAVDAHTFLSDIDLFSSPAAATDKKKTRTVYTAIKDLNSAYITYSMFDKNNNGYITPEELQAGLKSLCGIDVTDADVEAILRRYDDNNNGLLEPSELVPFFDDLKAHRSVTEILSSSMYESVYGSDSAAIRASKLQTYSAEYLTHALLDVNEDQHVTPEELRDALWSLGVRVSDTQLEALVEKYDDNPRNGV